MLSPMSANQLLTSFSAWLFGKGRPGSTNHHLPTLHDLPDLLQVFPLLHIITQQMPSITSLLLLTWVYKKISPSTDLQSSFPSAGLNAA